MCVAACRLYSYDEDDHLLMTLLMASEKLVCFVYTYNTFDRVADKCCKITSEQENGMELH